MSDHHRQPTKPTARKEHQCIYCGGPILVGEQYVQQTGYFDGMAYRNRYHSECYSALVVECEEWGEREFWPYNGEFPERVKAIVDARNAADELKGHHAKT